MYLLDTYAALTAASAIAANGLLRYIMGGTFPLFTTASMNAPDTCPLCPLLSLSATEIWVARNRIAKNGLN